MEKIQNKGIQKKGIALNQAFGAILTVVLIGVLVVIALVLFSSLGATFNTISSTTLNETITTVTEVAQAVTNATACGFSLGTLAAFNATGGELIVVADYTTTSGGLLATTAAAEVSGYNNTDWNVTYTFLSGGEACVANQTMIAQFATYPVLIGLIGTIIFLGLVIGVLVASFVFGGRRGV